MPTSRWICLSSICISRRSLRSRAPSGSSSSSTLGRLTRARASATRCRWPPESWVGRRSPYPPSRTVSSAASARSRRSAAGHLLHPQAVLHVGEHVHVREQRVVLEDGVDVAGERRPGVTSSPPRNTRPAVGSSKPAIIRSTVVLPEPDGPSIEKNSPSRISRSRPSTAVTDPKRLRDALQPHRDGRRTARDLQICHQPQPRATEFVATSTFTSRFRRVVTVLGGPRPLGEDAPHVPRCPGPSPARARAPRPAAPRSPSTGSRASASTCAAAPRSRCRPARRTAWRPTPSPPTARSRCSAAASTRSASPSRP